MVIPNKKIRFKRYVGQENWNGFKYGVNLKHIKRTIDSNQISTRVIVKPNKNEFAESGFCTIQRAHDNPLKENFLLDFSYYVQ
jgi:phage minor structural protein